MHNQLNFVSSSAFCLLGMAAQVLFALTGTHLNRRVWLALPSVCIQLTSWLNYSVDSQHLRILDKTVSHIAGTGALIWTFRSGIHSRATRTFMAAAYMYAASGYYILGGWLLLPYADQVQATIHAVCASSWFCVCAEEALHNHSRFLRMKDAHSLTMDLQRQSSSDLDEPEQTEHPQHKNGHTAVPHNGHPQCV
jgi:hypothetical protein